jgi:replication-associated recombination protein RarA
MSLFTQASLQYPASLTERYKPQVISDFIGLEKQKKILSKLAANPRPMNLLFVGESGTGKTSLAFAFAREISAEIHHITSQECKVENLQDTVRRCNLAPFDFVEGKAKSLHVIVIDEADQMSNAAQLYLLSRMDGTAPIPNTIIILTCNSTERFEKRFLSRCTELPAFNTYGAGDAIKTFLAQVWNSETANSEAPDFSRIPTGNVRAALQALEVELLAA